MAFSGAWNSNRDADLNRNRFLLCAALLGFLSAALCLFRRRYAHVITRFLRQKVESLLFSTLSAKFKDIPTPSSVVRADCTAPLESNDSSPAINGRTAELPSCSSTDPCRVLSMEERDLRRIFRGLDGDGDGMVSANDIQRLLQNLGLHCNKNIISHDEEEEEQQYFVNFDDFCSLCLLLFGCDEDEAEEGLMMEAFSVFDKNGDGFITHHDLQQLLLSLGFDGARDLELCKNTMKIFDTNCDGRIDFVEFRRMMRTPI